MHPHLGQQFQIGELWHDHLCGAQACRLQHECWQVCTMSTKLAEQAHLARCRHRAGDETGHERRVRTDRSARTLAKLAVPRKVSTMISLDQPSRHTVSLAGSYRHCGHHSYLSGRLSQCLACERIHRRCAEAKQGVQAHAQDRPARQRHARHTS